MNSITINIGPIAYRLIPENGETAATVKAKIDSHDYLPSLHHGTFRYTNKWHEQVAHLEKIGRTAK